MKLPVSIALQNTETSLGFVSRLAAANGYPSLETFLDCTETNAHSIASGHPEAMALLEEWAGEESDSLSRFALRSAGGKLRFKLGHAVFNREHRRGRAHRFCVRCVQDDLRHGEGRIASRPFVRSSWETRAIKTCPTHGSPITEVPCENGHDDFTLFVRTNMDAFAAEACADNDRFLHPGELDRYLFGRIHGATAYPFLDSLEALSSPASPNISGASCADTRPLPLAPLAGWKLKTQNGGSK